MPGSDADVAISNFPSLALDNFNCVTLEVPSNWRDHLPRLMVNCTYHKYVYTVPPYIMVSYGFYLFKCNPKVYYLPEIYIYIYCDKVLFSFLLIL